MNGYPLIFTPRFVEKVWGGRKLQTILRKELPPGRQIGESWEIYDFPPGVVDASREWVSSVVANGPLAGRTLHDLVLEQRHELLGDVAPVGPHSQFPLLIKFLDAREDLSVQVHPDSEYAELHPGAHLKTEAWYVLQHEPGSRLFSGLASGVTPPRLHHAIQSGTVEQHLEAIPAQKGQCHFLPSGTVHALGAGMLVAEVQTPSDTTFRLYDFNRIEPATGRPRTLHVEQAMQCIDFEADRSEAAARSNSASARVDSPYFSIREATLASGGEHHFEGGKPLILIMVEGSASLLSSDNSERLMCTAGQTVLLPASLTRSTFLTVSESRWLEVRFPLSR